MNFSIVVKTVNKKIRFSGTGHHTSPDLSVFVGKTPEGHIYIHAKSRDLIEEVEYRISLPLLNFGRILIPDSGRFYMHRFFPSTVWYQEFSLETRAIGNPFLVLMDLVDRPVFAFGLLGKLKETVFTITSPGVNRKNSLWVKRGRFAFTVRKKVNGFELKDGFFIKEGSKTWWHALREYGQTYQLTRDELGELDRHKLYSITDLSGGWKNLFHHTDRAYFPAFCTWLVINSDRMTHEWVLSMARKVKALGMEAFIFDDGWYGVGLDSFIPKIDIGDWPCSVEGKFPDLRETLRAVRDLGLNPILWFAPLAVGPDSRVFGTHRHLLVTHGGKLYKSPAGFHTLCIRNPEARRVILENVEKLIQCGAGGLKIDLFDYMSTEPCDADHHHDIDTIAEAMEVLLRDIFHLATSIDPDVVISVTNNHANVHLVPYASCVRGGDSPYDPNMLILRSIYPAAYTPLVHNDYALWTKYESPVQLAHIMIRQIFAGIPNFTVDFLKTPEGQNEVVKAWLGLFKRLKKLYKYGEFAPLDTTLTVWERRNGETGMVTLLPPATKFEIQGELKELYILNSTDNEELEILASERRSFFVEVFDHKIQRAGTERIQIPGKVPVLEAGLTVLKEETE